MSRTTLLKLGCLPQYFPEIGSFVALENTAFHNVLGSITYGRSHGKRTDNWNSWSDDEHIHGIAEFVRQHFTGHGDQWGSGQARQLHSGASNSSKRLDRRHLLHKGKVLGRLGEFAGKPSNRAEEGRQGAPPGGEQHGRPCVQVTGEPTGTGLDSDIVLGDDCAAVRQTDDLGGLSSSPVICSPLQVVRKMPVMLGLSTVQHAPC